MSESLEIQKLKSEVERLELIEKELKSEIGQYEMEDTSYTDDLSDAIDKLENSIVPDGLLTSEMKIDFLKENWEKFKLEALEGLIKK